MQKKTNKIIAFGAFVIASAFLLTPVLVHAQARTYQLLEKIPGASSTTGDLGEYIKSIYNLALILVVLSAVFMVTIGAFMYLMSAGNTSRIGAAKSIIFDSIFGLVLALSAWLFLYIINPDLVTLTINGLSPISVPGSGAPGSGPGGGSGGSGVTVPGEGRLSNNDAVNKLSAAGISVSSSGNCSDQNNRNCTSLEGIPASTIDNLIKLKANCGCSFSVTGGTEVGHQTHGTGRPIVDVSREANLKTYLVGGRTNGVLTSRDHITAICATREDQDVAFSCSYIEPQSHFHLVFSP